MLEQLKVLMMEKLLDRVMEQLLCRNNARHEVGINFLSFSFSPS
jgi:hypothetical protein